MSSLTEVWPAVESLSEKEKRKLYDMLVRGFQGGVSFHELMVDDSPVTKEERVRYFYPEIEDISRLVEPEVVIDPAIRDDPSLAATIDRATKLCAEIFEKLPGPVRFEWTKQKDQLRLTITDVYGFTGSKLFAVSRLEDEFGLKSDFLSIWEVVSDKRNFRLHRDSSPEDEDADDDEY